MMPAESVVMKCWGCGIDLPDLDPVWEPICTPCFAVVKLIYAFTIAPDLAAPAA